jgi:polyketide biosynthesis enoyl-CoA hydratase PksH
VELTSATVRLPKDLDSASIAALTRDFEAALASEAPVVAFTGADADTFCLGLAIGSSLDGSAATHAFSDLLTRMHDAPKPLLAVVDGRAIGGGMGLACACDWVVATDRATFALPELLWGLVPAIIWPVITSRMAPHVARQWTVSAHTRTASDGMGAGLVDDVVAPDTLDRAVARAARSLRRLDPEALRRLRAWARTSPQHDLADALRIGADITADMVRQPAVRKRWQAFEQGDTPWSE